MIHSAWGEAREGFFDIKPEQGFGSQKGIYQLDKERNDTPARRNSTSKGKEA